MEFRLAYAEDIESVKKVYREIVQEMQRRQIFIWDEIYPCDFLQEDICKGRFYLLLKDGRPIVGFALCRARARADQIGWSIPDKNALYLERFGVAPTCTGQGTGTLALEFARQTARTLGAKTLRLFVVDANWPASRFYRKNGFTQAAGFYDEQIDQDHLLREYGFETEL